MLKKTQSKFQKTLTISSKCNKSINGSSDEVFSHNSGDANGAATLDPSLRGKTAFGSDALFGRDEMPGASPSDRSAEMYKKAMDKGQELARQGAERLKGVLENYLKK